MQPPMQPPMRPPKSPERSNAGTHSKKGVIAVQIVIVGAGYAGLTTALRLARTHIPARIVLVNDRPEHQLTTQLHKVAAGSVPPDTVTLSLKRLLQGTGVQLLVGKVTAIDPEARYIKLEEDVRLSYDRLVVALGSEVETFGVPGVLEHAFHVQPLREALRLRSHIETLLLQAEQTPEAPVRLAVVGGGLTGVELAGELADALPKEARAAGVDPAKIFVTVLEAGPRLLPGLAEFLSKESEEALLRKGVTIRLNTVIESIRADGFVVKGEADPVHAEAVVWTAGVRGHRLTEAAFRSGPRGRALVDEFLRAADYPNVYIVGDNALAVSRGSERAVAPTAQNAVQQAHLVADNIVAEFGSGASVRSPLHRIEAADPAAGGSMPGPLAPTGPAAGAAATESTRAKETDGAKPLTPYVSKPLGLFVSVGQGEAVGELVFGDFWRPRLSGVPAYAMKWASEQRYKLGIGAAR